MKWTKKEIDFLKENYPDRGSNYCSSELRRSKNIIISKCFLLGIKFNKYKIWTEKEIEFLKENYPEHGSVYCSEFLNRSEDSIESQSHLLGLKLNKKIKSLILCESKIPKNKVPYKNFVEIKSKYIAYVLGFIWSDGNIYENILKSQYQISISINLKDKPDIENIFDKTGIWNKYEYENYDKRTSKKYKNFTLNTTNKKLVNFLIENDYLIKSICSPDKILETIPNELKHYFFRGMSDGDGCFYIKNKTTQYSISGSYNQDWKSIKDLFDKLNVKYSISKQISKKGKGSDIRVVNKNDIDIISNYLYGDIFDEIGLKRKYLKSTDIKKLIVKRSYPDWINEELEFMKENYSKMGVRYCSKKLNKSMGSIYGKAFDLNINKKWSKTKD